MFDSAGEKETFSEWGFVPDLLGSGNDQSNQTLPRYKWKLGIYSTAHVVIANDDEQYTE